MKSPDDIRDFILAAIEETKPLGLIGAQAGLKIRNAFRGFEPWKYGYSSLQSFILGEVPGSKVIRTNNSDVFYGLEHWPEGRVSEEPEQESSVGNVWRTWVSPALRAVIGVKKDSGHVRTIFENDSPVADELVIETPGSDFHVRLANDFASSLDVEADDLGDLKSISASGTSGWWKVWYQKLVEVAPAKAQEWWTYRTQKLREVFSTALRQANLDPEICKIAESQLRTAENLRSKETKKLSRAKAQAKTPTTMKDSFQRNLDLNQLVSEVASRMSESELRALSFPLGLVIDSIRDLSR